MIKIKRNKISSFKKLLSLFTKRERFGMLILSIFSLLTAVMQSTGVFSMMPFINIVMDTNSIHSNSVLSWLYVFGNFSDDMSFIIYLGIAVVVLLILSSVLSSFTSWLKNRFVLNVNYTLSKRLLEKYLSNPYEYFLQKNSSELGMNILSNATHLANNYLSSLIELVISSFLTLALIATLLLVNLKVTLLVFAFFGLTYGGMTFLVRSKLLKTGQQVNYFNKERHKASFEALNSIKITKALNLEDYFLNRYKKASKSFVRSQSFAKLISEIPNYVMEGMVFSVLIITIVILIQQGNDINSFIPMISLYAFAGYRLMPSLSRIFRAAINLYHNQPILEKVYEDMYIHKWLTDTSDDRGDSIQITEDEDPIISRKHLDLVFNEKIELQNIDFYYQGSQKIIDDLSLTVRKNSIVGFAGTTGAGKTTLIDILLGLLHTQSGDFLVDGIKVTDENVHSWQRMIGYVPQDIFLIDDSIQRNIAFGIPEKDIDPEKVKRSAQIAAIDQFIEEQLDNGYQTIVGERGVRLSGGQRQRIGLARALYRSPTILILDEATSALDGTTEEIVLNGIHKKSSVNTILIIAHRLNTLKVCDEIYLLENGRIIDRGDYDYLTTHNQKFMKMAKVE